MIKIGTDWWMVREVDLDSVEPGKFGDCDQENKVIRINSSLSKKEKKATLAHEIIHACCPDLTEDAVYRLEMALKSAGII